MPHGNQYCFKLEWLVCYIIMQIQIDNVTNNIFTLNNIRVPWTYRLFLTGKPYTGVLLYYNIYTRKSLTIWNFKPKQIHIVQLVLNTKSLTKINYVTNIYYKTLCLLFAKQHLLISTNLIWFWFLLKCCSTFTAHMNIVL